MKSYEEVDVEIIEEIRRCTEPIRRHSDLQSLMPAMENARLILLGEASHGTSEFYSWRAEITKQLIQKGDVGFVAIEADWPDTYLVNRFVKGRADMGDEASAVLTNAYKRWPTWMWANEETLSFVRWLRNYNRTQNEEDKVGFFGLDVYSLWESISVLRSYMKRHDPEGMGLMEDLINCLGAYGQDPQDYARAMFYNKNNCSLVAKGVLEEIRERFLRANKALDGERHFQALQNAHVLVAAEAYYRSMTARGPACWNIRDIHMADTVDRLLALQAGKKALIWEHNTHIGDARATDMPLRGETNVGQILRERHGMDAVFLLGFSSYEGTVIAGRNWDAPMQKMQLPPGHKGSWEELLHAASPDSKLIFLDRKSECLNRRRGHRAIGVVYHPESEAYGNYVATELAARYDALIYLEKTHALHPLNIRPVHAGASAETYPSSY